MIQYNIICVYCIRVCSLVCCFNIDISIYTRSYPLKTRQISVQKAIRINKVIGCQKHSLWILIDSSSDANVPVEKGCVGPLLQSSPKESEVFRHMRLQGFGGLLDRKDGQAIFCFFPTKILKKFRPQKISQCLKFFSMDLWDFAVGDLRFSLHDLSLFAGLKVPKNSTSRLRAWRFFHDKLRFNWQSDSRHMDFCYGRQLWECATTALLVKTFSLARSLWLSKKMIGCFCWSSETQQKLISRYDWSHGKLEIRCQSWTQIVEPLTFGPQNHEKWRF